MAQRRDAGLRALMMGAAFVVIIAGLRAAAPVIVPVLIAIFIAVLSVAPTRYLQKRGVPDSLAAIAVFAGVVVTLFVLSVVVGASLKDFDDNLPGYQSRLKESFSGVFAWAETQGFDLDFDEMKEALDPDVVVNFAQDLMRATSSVLSNTAFVLLTVAFILAEVTSFPRKLSAVLADRPETVDSYGHIVEDIQTYLAIKTQISMATGLCAMLLTWALGVDYPMLWGLVAFLLNFVPTLGSIIAGIPVVLLAFVQLSWLHALGVFVGYLVINVVFGSILEPRLMGRSLGLSTLVVFLSLVFWGWVFGPAGMLLSVPLTMVVKIFLENSEDLRWVAVVLGPADEASRIEKEMRANKSSGADDVELEDEDEEAARSKNSGADEVELAPAAEDAPLEADRD